MKSHMSADSWMNKQLNDYLDQQDDPAGSFSFRHKIRGGWANIQASTEWEDGGDEDGPTRDLVASIDYCHWCFSEDFEVDLDDYEKKEIKEKILELATDI